MLLLLSLTTHLSTAHLDFTPSYTYIPVYLHNIFMFSENVTGYVGRNSHSLLIPRMQTTYRQKGLFYRGVVAWNNIDQALYLATTLR